MKPIHSIEESAPIPARMCACGQPLHYTDPTRGTFVERMVEKFGDLVKITSLEPDRRSWLVPRHYIALHGLQYAELPELAKRYGFEEVTAK